MEDTTHTQARIAVVDDHEMFRAGVIATLQPYFDIVGTVARSWRRRAPSTG